jgi:predicted metalloprotease with PDZ domain
MSSAQNVTVNYEVAMPKPASHYFEVEVTFSGLPKSQKNLDVILPVWRPGRYLIFDFSSSVQEFTASALNKELKWYKTDKSTWRIETGSNTNVTLKYKVFANEFSQRTKGLDETHAFINGTTVFMYSEKYRDNHITLIVEPYNDWHVTSGLDNVKGSSTKFTAPDYDYFADCPLEIGNQTDFEFEVDGRKHIVSISGEANYDKQRIIDDFTKIIKYNFKFWGGVPYKKYVFIVHVNPQGSGGTEHINSTIVGIRPAVFETEAGYTAFLRLISHEFFHTWNVKQLKPKGLTPYDYTKENYTGELWIAEGGTSYYDGLILLRTGQMHLEEFYKEITKGAEEERKRPGNRVQSLAESSFDAWVKFWKTMPNKYNSESDYYAKGSYVCLLLDLEIRNSSKNKFSLDDVFRTMYKQFPLDKKGYTNDDFRKTSEKFVDKSLKKFFDDYVYGIIPLDWEKYLSYAGLELKSNDTTITSVAGLVTSKQGDKIIVESVLPGSSAEEGGIKNGDEIIAYNSERLNYEDMEKRIKELKTGDKVTLNVFRDDKIREFTLTMQEKKLMNY